MFIKTFSFTHIREGTWNCLLHCSCFIYQKILRREKTELSLSSWARAHPTHVDFHAFAPCCWSFMSLFIRFSFFRENVWYEYLLSSHFPPTTTTRGVLTNRNDEKGEKFFFFRLLITYFSDCFNDAHQRHEKEKKEKSCLFLVWFFLQLFHLAHSFRFSRKRECLPSIYVDEMGRDGEKQCECHGE